MISRGEGSHTTNSLKNEQGRVHAIATKSGCIHVLCISLLKAYPNCNGLLRAAADTSFKVNLNVS